MIKEFKEMICIYFGHQKATQNYFGSWVCPRCNALLNKEAKDKKTYG